MSSQVEGVLVVGCGPILLSLVKAWYESGLSKLTVYVTNTQLTDMEELKKLLEHALPSDPGASLDIHAATGDEEVNWETEIRPFPFILYTSQPGDLEELRELQAACTAEMKPMLPVMGLRGMGMVGPLHRPDGDGWWESAWRRIHSSVFPADGEPQRFSATAAAVLSNLLVHEWGKAVTEEEETHCIDQCYILDPITLEGSWHSILPHPFITGHEQVRMVTDMELRLGIEQEPADSEETEEWFTWFNKLTSMVSGIFHVWEEGSLNQLPLAQCLVQPADPLSEGPAQLLPTIICSGLTHVEARRESGLAGIESYTARMTPLLVSELPSDQPEDIHIGAGGTFAEALGRGLRACLDQELGMRPLHNELVLTRMECTQIEDVRCQYYLQAISILEGEPVIAVGESLLGFPVVWVCSGGAWYGSVGLDLTLALRGSLQKALMKTECAPVSSVIWNDHKKLQSVIIPSNYPTWNAPWMLSAVQTLKQHHKRLEVVDMRCESFLREGPFEVLGIRLREEESL
ncbi:hypothetical protein GC093_14850 [Paenibacillus sp. LMG 31456]|uniref:Thiazole-containing bacteriocin maturation protein n=1 Tax=Paenibacillus foliorum TaxID=2654974 RepID=A0A972GX53_9BACL|nr:hypothetical protein [Paenibacillus foliorum]NOU94485.1 hypothetical protein [Paenibacillus foliorum]